MNQVSQGNGNGNGNGANGLLQATRKKAVPAPAASAPPSRDSLVSFRAADGTQLKGQPARVSRHALVLEMFSPAVVPRFSEVLEEFKVTLQGREVYSGRAVVRNVVDTGTRVVCEVTLTESHWTDVNAEWLAGSDGQIGAEFKAFLKDWQKLYKVLPEFKVVVADMHTFFEGLIQWLSQVELKLAALPAVVRVKREPEVLKELSSEIIPLVNVLFERFEIIAKKMDASQQLACSNHMRRQLHAFVMSAPFAYRTYHKPLGYAGDFEMINMILRNGFEGTTFFGKIMHAWFVQQAPAMAHRNRIDYLAGKLEEETFRIVQKGQKARVYNFACGPAVEVQNFFNHSAIAEFVEITLADFNEETLISLGNQIRRIRSNNDLKAGVRFQKKTVHQLIKDGVRQDLKKHQHQYDFVYCAGLFDYLSDNTCKQLTSVFYDWLAPDGLLVVTNVEPSNPMRYGMEHLLDWHLIYRSAEDLKNICPRQIDAKDAVVRSDETGVNVFMEVRKSGK